MGVHCHCNVPLSSSAPHPNTALFTETEGSRSPSKQRAAPLLSITCAFRLSAGSIAFPIHHQVQLVDYSTSTLLDVRLWD